MPCNKCCNVYQSHGIHARPLTLRLIPGARLYLINVTDTYVRVNATARLFQSFICIPRLPSPCEFEQHSPVYVSFDCWTLWNTCTPEVSDYYRTTPPAASEKEKAKRCCHEKPTNLRLPSRFDLFRDELFVPISSSFHQIYSVQWPQSQNIKLISWWYIFVLVVQQKVSS